MALTFSRSLSHSPSLPQLQSSASSIPLRRPLKTRTSAASTRLFAVRCCSISGPGKNDLRTCRNCKTQFDPSLNHPRACRFHTAHFGGETRRKFESVYSGGTMDTPNSGKVFQYWHCCGSEDPFDPGCTAAPHASYDD
ncbi:uncharacterized protein LOC115737166 [Rhodamnia argentea]|uniref:Uncharacterized protein LOC115737166 n=1 Tax=Rhodamnia argentea TaxID=178133 RepID=A0A8B8NR90_9MYRT|nr:uncharacterized protein LOC115737166 [Rhodamnia argentea]